jgi:hypothetical protein
MRIGGRPFQTASSKNNVNENDHLNIVNRVNSGAEKHHEKDHVNASRKGSSTQFPKHLQARVSIQASLLSDRGPGEKVKIRADASIPTQVDIDIAVEAPKRSEHLDDLHVDVAAPNGLVSLQMVPGYSKLKVVTVSEPSRICRNCRILENQRLIIHGKILNKYFLSMLPNEIILNPRLLLSGEYLIVDNNILRSVNIT